MNFKEACLLAFRDNRCLPALVSELQDCIWEKGNLHGDTLNTLETYTKQLIEALTRYDVSDDAGYQQIASDARRVISGKGDDGENVIRFKRIHNSLSEAIYGRLIFSDVY